MDRKIVYALVAVIVVLLGVLVFGKKNDAVPQELLEQQTQILMAVNKLSGSEDAPTDLVGLSKKVQSLEQKLTAMESQWTELKSILVKAQEAGNRAQKLMDDFAPPAPDKQYDIPVGSSYVRGDKNAPITIVEFVDFQCPFCARFHEPILSVLKAYPNQVKYILKNYPLSFHPQARPAAKAALAAGEQGKYWEMSDLILDNNRELTEEKFQEYAKQLGLNVDKFLKDYKDRDAEWEKIIDGDMALGDQVDVEGTPTFYLNGRKTMARNFEQFKQEIDQFLKAQ